MYNAESLLISILAEIDLNDQIFFALTPSDKYENSHMCQICKSKFGILLPSKNCFFCGKQVCSKCLLKKRQNPENPNEFVKICEICEEKYLTRMIILDFLEKKSKKDSNQDKINCALMEIKDEMAKKEKSNKKFISEKEENIKQNREEIERLRKKVGEKTAKISKIEEEHKILLNLDQKINISIAQENEKSKQLITEYQEAKNELEDITKEINITNEKCAKIQNFIEETEAEISKQSAQPIISRNTINYYSKSVGLNGEGSLNISASRRDSYMMNDQALKEKVCCHIM